MKINDITSSFYFNQQNNLDIKAIYDTALMLVNDPDLTIDDLTNRWYRHMISTELFRCYCHLYQLLYCIALEDKYFPQE